MKTPAERKEAARQFLKEHANTGQRIKTRKFYDDDPNEIIPQRGRRGRGRIFTPDQSVSRKIQTSSIFSTHLAKSASTSLFWERAVKIIGKKATTNPKALPVILDTNVVAAGLFPSRDDGIASKRLMELVLEDGEIAPSVTWAIVGEYRDILRKLGDNHLNQLCRFLSRSVLIPALPGDIEIPSVDEDPSDTLFIEALVLGLRGLNGNKRQLNRLVTRDHHLLDLATATDSAELLNGRIVTPRDILRELRR